MSFQQGLSGLNATSKNLDVIGNNVANANTFGEKSSRAEFTDVYANAMNGASSSPIGIGVTVSSVTQQFTQGNIVITDNSLDLAINGAGFFQVNDGGGSLSYTRNGQFRVDRDGFVVNSRLQKLVGYPADASGQIQTGKVDTLRVPSAGLPPSASTRITMELNLDSRAAVRQPASSPLIDFADPTTYNNSTSLSLYDAKGQDVAVSYYFQKAATDTWDVYVTANGTSINVDALGNPTAATRINYPSNGGSPLSPSAPVPLNIPATLNSVGAQTLPLTGVELDVSGLTQYGSPFGVTDLSQNGYAPGQLAGIQFENDGTITARYSNGQIKAAGQVLLATFRNPQGLQPLGGTGWAASFQSGDPIVGAPGAGNLGVLQSGALEESNVDLTAELVNMITAQRAYQANAQTIKTQDQVLQTLVNLR